MRHIGLSGANGFIGRHLATSLRDAGHQVRALSRTPAQWDLAGIDVLIHAAGLAHELNQPLMAMSAMAEGALLRLERDKLPEPKFASVCQRIANDALRAGEIIKRLRNFVQKREAQ